MEFEKQILDELLAEVSGSQGGVVLESEGKPAAVVLSVEKYTEMQARDKISPTPAVLVLGGAGYIGSHTAKLLVEEGLLPVVVDNLSTGFRENASEPIVFVEGDAGDQDLIRHLASQYQFVAALHFAASIEVEESMRLPEKYLRNNLKTTMDLLEILDELKIRRVVFSSTAAVYGEPESTPITEDALPAPVSPYGASKLLCEQLLRYYAAYKNFSVTCFRYFNVAGSVPEWQARLRPTATHLFPSLLRATTTQERFVLFGQDYATRDGSAVRDYLHVLDVARAHVAVLRAPAPVGFSLYNLGTGHGISVKEAVSAVAEIAGKMVSLETGPRREGDPAMLVASADKIQKEIGFSLKYSNLRDIILSLWKPSEFRR